MTLEQLRIFVAVAEREHATRAAHDLNLTQSAVSAAVANLEARYATKLFDRVGRSIVLTEAGRVFLSEARAVLARAAAAETVLADLAGMKKGRLALAASQTVAAYWLPPLIHRYRGRYPGVSVTLSIANTESVAAMVHAGDADVGVVEGEIDDPALTATAVARDDMVLVVSADHPWARAAAVSTEDLTGTPWVLREAGSGTRGALETVLSAAGLELKDMEIAIELASNEAVRTAVEAGAGATVLSRLVVKSGIASGALVEVEFPLPARRFYALRHKERHFTNAAEAFVALMRETSAAPAGLSRREPGVARRGEAEVGAA